jgi:hypothetical protein
MCKQWRPVLTKEGVFQLRPAKSARKEAMAKNISLTLKDWLALERMTNYWCFDAAPSAKKYLNTLHDKILAHAELAEKSEKAKYSVDKIENAVKELKKGKLWEK